MEFDDATGRQSDAGSGGEPLKVTHLYTQIGHNSLDKW